jgi:glycosyltransferase involved in cell wall biosynthesis
LRREKIHFRMAGSSEEVIKRLSVKVLLVTGAYPPVKCGVGDYTCHLAEALAEISDVEVGVVTTGASEEPTLASKVCVFRVVFDWRLRNFPQIKWALSQFCPDVVHIQYPTQGYNGWIPKFLPVLIRLMGIPVVQTWHEHFSDCRAIGGLNLLGCDALIYVRPDLPNNLPAWVSRWLGKTPLVYVPNTSTIPNVSLSSEHAMAIKQELSGGKPIVCYFGFANPNKGIERVFEIADSKSHHLVLICDLNENHPYQANILKRTSSGPWAGKVTVTGFQPATNVGQFLAVADAVLFPFLDGAGEWNTSLKAAEAAGVFTIATTKDSSVLGYHEKRNIYFASCDDMPGMQVALKRYLGRRVESRLGNEWGRIATEHERIYRSLCK